MLLKLTCHCSCDMNCSVQLIHFIFVHGICIFESKLSLKPHFCNWVLESKLLLKFELLKFSVRFKYRPCTCSCCHTSFCFQRSSLLLNSTIWIAKRKRNRRSAKQQQNGSTRLSWLVWFHEICESWRNILFWSYPWFVFSHSLGRVLTFLYMPMPWIIIRWSLFDFLTACNHGFSLSV